jgi:hypothetical protein
MMSGSRAPRAPPVTAPRYEALLVDLDGTLLDESGRVLPESARALRAVEARGGRVMIATGRSTVSARPVLEELGLATPAIVFNGAGLWCPARRRMLEERVLSTRTLERALDFGARRDLLTVVMTNERKLSSGPRDEAERNALSGLHGLEVVARPDLRVEFVIRVTYFSDAHPSSQHLFEEVEREVGLPVYLTHFPLNALATHRASTISVLDLHPPCRGKAEGLRALEELYGVPPERVVAIGDATNDIPMLEAAGLGVAMGDGMPEAIAAADRVIGDNDSTAIAELVEELFLRG